MKELVVRICDLDKELRYLDKENFNFDYIMDIVDKNSFEIECGDKFKEICKCFDECSEKKIIRYNQYTGTPIYKNVIITRCKGTKEQDECSCNGDKRQCTFYPEYKG